MKCPVRPDVSLGGKLEVVFFSEQNYTAGSTFGDAQKAREHLASWKRGAVVSYITAPDWSARGIERFPEGVVQEAGA